MSTTVNWGILSTAEIADKVKQAIDSSPSGKVQAVASRSLEKAKKWAETRNIPTAYGSYDELLTDKSLDVIYIPLPTKFKTPWAIKAAKAGKHVLLEKPLPEDISLVIDACKENKVQFMDGTMWLHSIRTKTLSKVLHQEKQLGNVWKVNSAFTFKAPSEEWLQGGNGRTDKTREPMGCLGDQGWYPLGAILFAFNYAEPKKININWVRYNKVDTIVSGEVSLVFEDGRYGTFDFGVEAPHRSWIEFVGKDGVVRIDDQVGGQARTGNFNAYFKCFVGSGLYYHDDVQGKETKVEVEKSDHTMMMVEDMNQYALGKGDKDVDWPKRSLVTQTTLCRIFNEIEKQFPLNK